MTKNNLIIFFFCAVFIVLTLLFLSMPSFEGTISQQAAHQMDALGISHPVTAVLMYFRSLDTLLEVAVIFTALCGFYALYPRFLHTPPQPRSIVADHFTTLIFPVIAVASAVLLYSGTFQSGGAFQAAALLAGGIIIIKLTRPLSFAKTKAHGRKFVYVFGLLVFVLLGFVSLFSGSFLAFATGSEYWQILTVETALTLSLAATMAAFFIMGIERVKR
ncbi:MAG: MnhB domain-containing protein [Campylobacterota bacterium]